MMAPFTIPLFTHTRLHTPPCTLDAHPHSHPILRSTAILIFISCTTSLIFLICNILIHCMQAHIKFTGHFTHNQQQCWPASSPEHLSMAGITAQICPAAATTCVRRKSPAAEHMAGRAGVLSASRPHNRVRCGPLTYPVRWRTFGSRWKKMSRWAST